MIRRLRLWLPVAAYVVVIFGLSSLHRVPRLLTFDIQDKIYHVIEYCVLGLLVIRALRGAGYALAVSGACAVLFAAVTGTLDELYQMTVPGRFATVSDAVADTLGAVLAWVLWATWQRLRAARPTRHQEST